LRNNGGAHGLSGAGAAVSWPHKESWNKKDRQLAEQIQTLTGHRVRQKLIVIVINRMVELSLFFLRV
jgi:hypothetical protein